MIINLILSVLIYVGLFFFNEPVIRIFNRESDLVAAASKALSFFNLSFIPMALNLIYTSMMFSTKRTLQANAIAVCRGIIVKEAAVFCIPLFFGSEVIWLAPLVAETITLVLAFILSKITKQVYQ